jgi:hypothetical protein
MGRDLMEEFLSKADASTAVMGKRFQRNAEVELSE